jgi:nucleotide-binding universal stress UspA family protein
MFERILFPTDFSVYANTVTACLPSLQSAGVKEVILLHVIRASEVPLPETYNLESYKYIRWSAEEQLNLLSMVMEGHGLRARTRIEYGSPVAEIIRVAKEEHVSMIVVGAQGKTMGQELMIGSTAFEIIRRSPVPVLLEKAEVVREEGHSRCRWSCAEMFRRVLHPTDFSTFADEAYAVIEKLRAVGTQEVVLLHVQDERVMKHRTPEQLADFDRKDRDRLEERCQHLSSLGFKARMILRHGNPVQETLQVADETKVGLIVMGSQGRSAIQELMTGSTLESVVRLAKQPVLMVRGTK